MTAVTIDELKLIAEARLEPVVPGNSLDAAERSLIVLAVAASVTSLDADAINRAIDDAFDAGATTPQIQEIISLVSGLGVHSLMVASARIVDAAARAKIPVEQSLDPERQRLWDKHVGDDPYWVRFDQYAPGFLKAMLQLSPAQFDAFFQFCAVPWQSRAVSAQIKELAAIACDASPTHRFLPGFLLHLDMAIKTGAGRRAILETMDIAAAAPAHRGTR